MPLFLGVALLARVLTDDLSSPDSRHSTSFNLSGAIATLFIVVAAALLRRRRKAVLPTILASLWLSIWTVIAVHTSGLSTETLREGVREASVVALGVIVCNAGGTVTAHTATRLVQVVGFVPAVLALYQLPTHTGMLVGGHIRSNGTFAQPNSAVMFFGLATIASLWRYLDRGRQRSDSLLVALFGAAAISTFSIDGLLALVAMLLAFAALDAGGLRTKLVPCAVAGAVILAFVATPLGAQRVGKESSISLASAARGRPNTDLAWRLHKWETLMPGWENSPLVGRGLGTTTTEAAIAGNRFAGVPPLNEYVRYLVETGVVGLVLLLGAAAALMRDLVSRRQSPGAAHADNRDAATLAIVVVIGCLINALADNTLLNSPTAYAATLIVVAVLCMGRTGTAGRRSAPSSDVADPLTPAV
ncbi:MAG TPA: O-antigen ligase family protein [Solirubrobacteraceae bacterium]